MARPLSTQTRWATLERVFSTHNDEDEELHALIACLCVLFEDLRIEISGQAASDLGGLDACGAPGRKLYFLRRSIATLHEFTAVLLELDQLPSFQPIRARFNPVVQAQWARAVAYFKKHHRYIARVRHHVGGHFNVQGGKLAIENLLPDAIGALEVRFTNEGGGAKLLFASEIAATGALIHVPGNTIAAKSRRFVRHALVAYRLAARAVDCVTVSYLCERFGRH